MTAGSRPAHAAPQHPAEQRKWIETPCNHNAPAVHGSSGQTYCQLCLRVKEKKPPNVLKCFA